MDGQHRCVVGVDIGGANLKYCGLDRVTIATPFAMWQQRQQLAETLVADLNGWPNIDSLVVTMTGELADCFADRELGVRHIVRHTMTAARRLGIADVQFYGVDGMFHVAAQAEADPDRIAAANWHAVARFVAQRFTAATLMIDIGSTTTDIIPLHAGTVRTTARTDHQRLCEGSLVYIGCRRTPVCALVDQLQLWDTSCAVMNEFFATIDDARLLMGTTESQPDDGDTADKQPRTAEHAALRIARMIGLDRRTVSIADATALAKQVIDAARLRIARGFDQLYHGGPVVVAGHGSDLLPLSRADSVIQLADTLGASVSRCAPSFAVASLYESARPPEPVPCDV
jgi:probable H4MPT-linked C1 transfer pathway protein